MIDLDTVKLTYYPAKILTLKATDVEVFDDNLRAFVDKMYDIMLEHTGVGLAAPQANVPLRLFLVSLDGTRENTTVFINPKLELTGPLESNEEGCLSFPNMYTKVKRYRDCKVTAQNLEGQKFAAKAEGGLGSRCLQHEYDHIEGITLANRMSQAARIVHRRLLKKLEEQDIE
ncbi:MAG: peptide deformylase [Planctomycetes bacterium]|nr:peptide deformylase [Planctomycetota bacterium]